jgi:hypothetical protein
MDQHVEDLAFGIDGAPKIDHAAIDFQIDFIQMPGRIRIGSAFTQVCCDHRPEMIYPAPNGLIVLLSQKVAGPSAENQLCGEIQSSAGGAGMNLRSVDRSKSRFAAYVEGLVSVIGHADRASPLRDYCLGLIMPCERKSVEPMAAITAPDRTAAQHQSLLHFVGQSPWSNEKVLAKVGEMVVPAIEPHGPIEAWIIDDTGFPKKGQYSVGVARQYCGQLGKRENCQAAVSLSLANHQASLPVVPSRMWLKFEGGVISGL